MFQAVEAFGYGALFVGRWGGRGFRVFALAGGFAARVALLASGSFQACVCLLIIGAISMLRSSLFSSASRSGMALASPRAPSAKMLAMRMEKCGSLR